MTANEEVSNESKNGEVQERQETVDDTNEQKSNIEAEKVELLPINKQESNPDKNEKKSDEESTPGKNEKKSDEESTPDKNEKKSDEESTPDKNEKKSDEQESDLKESNPVEKRDKKKETQSDLVVRIIGFTRLKNEIEEHKLYHTFFTQEIGISAPLVETSARFGDAVIFTLKSDEDKAKLFSRIKKRKIFKWRNYSLELKGMQKMSLGKDFRKLSLDEALKILYPYREIPYGKQLKEKTEASKNVINAILPQKEANLNIKQMVPMTAVEGYDYHVPLSIEEESETNRTIYGIRVMSEDRRNTCIVPIELCPNVPHQLALVAKDFVDHMSEFSFIPFSKTNREGNILGISLQMTQSGNFIMTMFVPTTKLEQFKQLTPNGVDGEVITIDNFSKSNETRESFIEKAEIYYNSRGKDNGIVSVYMSIISSPLGVVWNFDNSLPEAIHILGDSSVPTFYNGQQIQMTWTKDYQINNSVIPILNIMQEWGYITSNSSICISCNHKIVPLYLANKVEKLTVLCSSKKGYLTMMKEWGKKMGLNKTDFFDINKINRFNSPIKNNATAIIWHSIKKNIVDGLLAIGVTNIILVSYWKKDPPSEFIKSIKEPLGSISKNLEILNVFPIDIAPYTDRFCLLIFFHAKKYLLARKRSYDSLETLQPYYEADYNRMKRFKASYF